MVSDIDGLLAAVLAEPECDVVRGAYADALEETQVPANVARAEFIRLQIEIPRLMAIVHRWVNTPSNKPGGTAKDGGPAGAAHGTACSLENRAEKLFEQYKCEWFGERVAIHYLGFESEDAEGQYPDLATTVVSRGFIHIVRGPLAVLRDGECGCENGGVDTGGTTPWGAPISVRCEECQGTGRTAGILRELVRREPVEFVQPTDGPTFTRSGDGGWVIETPANIARHMTESGIVDAIRKLPASAFESQFAKVISDCLLAEAKGPVPA